MGGTIPEIQPVIMQAASCYKTCFDHKRFDWHDDYHFILNHNIEYKVPRYKLDAVIRLAVKE